MPSVLIETGFLTNNSEERFLSQQQGQDEMASAIFRAFREYKLEKEGLLKQTASKPEANNKPKVETAEVVQKKVQNQNVEIKNTISTPVLKRDTLLAYNPHNKQQSAKANIPEIKKTEKKAEPKPEIKTEVKAAVNTPIKENKKTNINKSTSKVISLHAENEVLHIADTVDEMSLNSRDIKILYTFSVQIGISAKPLPLNNEFFKGIEKSRIFSENTNNAVKYTVDNTQKLSEAIEVQSEMRAKGFAGAFVVAYKNGIRIPLKEAVSQMGKK